MSLDEKLEFFQYLVNVGFKEIEIGFPAASDTEYAFCRTLIEKNLIPEDVTIQVLTQSREHIIQKTFEALKGAHSAIVHLYRITSYNVCYTKLLRIAKRKKTMKLKAPKKLTGYLKRYAKMVSSADQGAVFDFD